MIIEYQANKYKEVPRSPIDHSTYEGYIPMLSPSEYLICPSTTSITTDTPLKLTTNGVAAIGYRVYGNLLFLKCNLEAIIDSDTCLRVV